MIVIYVLAAAFIVMAVLLLLGKGDMLIAGYNTASPEERSQYNMRRLRLLIAALLIVVSVGMVAMSIWPEKLVVAFTFLTVFLCFLVVFLANTWAKKGE